MKSLTIIWLALIFTTVVLHDARAQLPAATTALADEVGKRMPAAERKRRVLEKLPDGRQYQRHEIRAVLTEDYAASLSGLGGRRQRARAHQIVQLHPAILRVESGNPAARAWLNALAFPAPIAEVAVQGKRGDAIPRIARTVMLILRRGEDADAVLPALRALPQFEKVFLKTVQPLNEVPTDAFYNLQWAPAQIGLPEAWDVIPRAPIKVAIIDTGVKLIHPDLSPRIVGHAGFGDFDTGDALDWQYGGDHGTHVAGIVAAAHNAVGIAGVSDYAQILALNCATFNHDENKYKITNADDAIDTAVANGARVINCSFGSGGDLDGAINDAIDNAFEHNVLVVCAAGNESTDIDGQHWAQSAVPFLVSATRLLFSDNPTGPVIFAHEYSNFGDRIDIAAPGTEIYSTVPQGTGWDYKQGTSMAAPQVAGAAVLLMSLNPNRIYDSAAKHLLIRMAQDAGPAGRDPQYGWGHLRVRADFCRVLRDADAFVSNLDLAQAQTGNYDSPYQSIQSAVNSVADHAVLVLNGGDVSAPSFHYPNITITKPCKLTVLPDGPVTIGQP